MSDLVGNSEDRFSHNEAHLKIYFQDLFVLLDLIGSSDVVFKNFFRNTGYHFGWLQKIGKLVYLVSSPKP